MSDATMTDEELKLMHVQFATGGFIEPSQVASIFATFADLKEELVGTRDSETYMKRMAVENLELAEASKATITDLQAQNTRLRLAVKHYLSGEGNEQTLLDALKSTPGGSEG